jgi:hypothetical protein
MSELSPLSGEERKSNFGVVRSVDDPKPETERHCLHEENFNGHGAVVSYLNNVRTTKETDVVQIVNDAQGADDMSDHDEWISYSHWGMFTLGRKSSN